MFFVKLLTWIAFFACIAWFLADPGFEPGIAIITTLCTLIGIWLSGRPSSGRTSQRQAVGQGGVGIQAGGDAHVGNISNGVPKDAQ